MVRAIIEAHEGTVSLETGEGRGTTFLLRLPAASLSSSLGQRGAVARRQVKGEVVSVLVADDDELVRGMLLSALSRLGFQVRAVPDGKSLLTLAQEKGSCDVLLIDDSMPNVRGIDLLGSLSHFQPNALIILTSGDTALKHVVESQHPGVHFLGKPFMLSELSAMIDNARSGIAGR
jgi:FixJ family two-component response regulator